MKDTSRNDDIVVDRFQIALVNEQSDHPVDDLRLIEAVTAVLQDSSFSSAAISLAIVDDETIHGLNRRHLEHDYPTDVLSFVLEDDGNHLEGEVILSADTAATIAAELGHRAADEQLLYVIHGMLHLVGYNDKSPEDAKEMCVAEAHFLRKFGVEMSRRVVP